MAHADGQMHENEEHIVKTKMTKLYEEGADLALKFESGLQQYRSVKKEDIQDIIKETFLHFNSVKFSTKYRVYTDMYDIINADGRVDESETGALEQLRKIISVGSA